MTDVILKFDKFINNKFKHPSNILSKFETLDVLKLDKSNKDKDKQL